MVPGRVINGYSSKDLILGVVYRVQRMSSMVAGVTEINCAAGIENFDLSHVIKEHLDYAKNMKAIMQIIDLTHSHVVISGDANFVNDINIES